MGQKCQIVLGDICTPETAEKFATAAEEWGGLDILVNNAGILDRDGTLQTTPETFDHIIQVNLVSVFRITQKLLQALCERKVASSISHLPLPVRLIPTRTRPMARPSWSHGIDSSVGTGICAAGRSHQCGAMRPHRDGYVPELDARIPRKGDVGSTFASSRNTLGRGAVCRVPCK